MNVKKIRSRRSKEKTGKRVSVNFTPTEYAHFLTMKEKSGVSSLSLFIKARVFNETFRVIKIDCSLLNYRQKLTTLYGQFRSVGVNYNQTVVAMKSNFTEKKTFTMLAKLEKLTLELAIIGGEIVQLTREFQEKWQQRQ
ncbi:conjugal transfer protein MobA [Bacteroides heparinolyticus]|uniref:conjugal transfer protein MobA n=2 Tax=Prevotella heparinolytica TaxID=28113 RepID=UPI00359FA0EA